MPGALSGVASVPPRSHELGWRPGRDRRGTRRTRRRSASRRRRRTRPRWRAGGRRRPARRRRRARARAGAAPRRASAGRGRPGLAAAAASAARAATCRAAAETGAGDRARRVDRARRGGRARRGRTRRRCGHRRASAAVAARGRAPSDGAGRASGVLATGYGRSASVRSNADRDHDSGAERQDARLRRALPNRPVQAPRPTGGEPPTRAAVRRAGPLPEAKIPPATGAAPSVSLARACGSAEDVRPLDRRRPGAVHARHSSPIEEEEPAANLAPSAPVAFPVAGRCRAGAPRRYDGRSGARGSHRDRGASARRSTYCDAAAAAPARRNGPTARRAGAAGARAGRGRSRRP